MSSTNRGTPRQALDYYVTPISEICKFLEAWEEDIGVLPSRILDPCAGGNLTEMPLTLKEAKDGKPAETCILPPTPMSYPEALARLAEVRVNVWSPNVITSDIREDSPADTHNDFLKLPVLPGLPLFTAVISNPPFALAIEFIKKGLEIVEEGGYVAMLLRANFFGSEKRAAWFQKNMPEFIYFHSNRMSFTPNGKKDSVEYVHAVWRKGEFPKHAKFRVLDY